MDHESELAGCQSYAPMAILATENVELLLYRSVKLLAMKSEPVTKLCEITRMLACSCQRDYDDDFIFLHQ